MEANVKIMLSYDYNHFEISISEECEDLKAVNTLRKNAQRLADEAVRQYIKAKEMAGHKASAVYEKEEFLREIKDIQIKPEGERTINEAATLKLYEDNVWQSQFNYDYDYEDDELSPCR